MGGYMCRVRYACEVRCGEVCVFRVRCGEVCV